MAVSSSKHCFSCVAAILVALASLSGCAQNIPDPGLNIDQTIKTASIGQTPEPADSNVLGLDRDTFLDGETISNAVSSVQFNGSPIAWQNPATGSSGEIISVFDERLSAGTLCRKFEVLRTSYDGIRNYAGSTCMNTVGAWQLTSFQLR
ncbi:MAG: RT0821/Lpp0805 family surface protein [Notoacmeibacter sp.]